MASGGQSTQQMLRNMGNIVVCEANAGGKLSCGREFYGCCAPPAERGKIARPGKQDRATGNASDSPLVRKTAAPILRRRGDTGAHIWRTSKYGSFDWARDVPEWNGLFQYILQSEEEALRQLCARGAVMTEQRPSVYGCDDTTGRTRAGVSVSGPACGILSRVAAARFSAAVSTAN